MNRLVVALLIVVNVPGGYRQIVRPPLKPGEISDELMAEAIEEGLAGHGDFGSAACIAKRNGDTGGGLQWRVVFRGPASRIADTAARALSTHQASGVVPPEMMKAPEISVEISRVPATGAADAAAPTRMAIASLRTTTGRGLEEVAPAAFQWSAADAAGGSVASATFRRTDLPPEFDVVLRGESDRSAWSCSLTRDEVGRIQ
jgi:hypothetical protein